MASIEPRAVARHLHACQAFRLAVALTDGELAVLMASQRLAKRGDTHRVFDSADLDKPSVTRALDPLHEPLGRCLAALVRKGMLRKRGRRGFEATASGNVVKHTFNAVAAEVLLGPYGSAWFDRPRGFQAFLRDQVRRACEER